MIFSIPIWIIMQLVNVLILLPLSFLGNALASDWLIQLSLAIPFLFRPLLYFQGVLDAPMALKTIGWCMGVFWTWLMWIGMKFLYSLIRGHNFALNPNSKGENDT